ncbi:MAG: IS1 family transposase [Flavobacteriales bacterium]
MNYIERKNLTLRQHLRRLSRRTLGYSRSPEMLQALLRIYCFVRSKYAIGHSVDRRGRSFS